MKVHIAFAADQWRQGARRSALQAAIAADLGRRVAPVDAGQELRRRKSTTLPPFSMQPSRPRQRPTLDGTTTDWPAPRQRATRRARSTPPAARITARFGNASIAIEQSQALGANMPLCHPPCLHQKRCADKEIGDTWRHSFILLSVPLRVPL
jgi:hypothetical protein